MYDVSFSADYSSKWVSGHLYCFGTQTQKIRSDFLRFPLQYLCVLLQNSVCWTIYVAPRHYFWLAAAGDLSTKEARTTVSCCRSYTWLIHTIFTSAIYAKIFRSKIFPGHRFSSFLFRARTPAVTAAVELRLLLLMLLLLSPLPPRNRIAWVKFAVEAY